MAGISFFCNMVALLGNILKCDATYRECGDTIEALAQYFSYLHLPEDYVVLLQDIDRHIIQKLVALEAIENGTLLPASPDSVRQLRESIDQQLAQKGKQSIYDIRMEMVKSYRTLCGLQKDMASSRKSFSFFKIHNQVELRISVSEDEQSPLLNEVEFRCLFT